MYYYSNEDDRIVTTDEIRTAYEECLRSGNIPDDVSFEHFVEGCLARNNGDLTPVGEHLPVLFEDEIRNLLRSCEDGDTFTCGSVLFRVRIHTVDDDGIKSRVTEYLDYVGDTFDGDPVMTIYDLLNQGKVVRLNGDDITSHPATVI